MLKEDFQAAFARLSGVLQGDVGEIKVCQCYIFRAIFFLFLQGAFMLCNVWDVLAPFQQLGL